MSVRLAPRMRRLLPLAALALTLAGCGGGTVVTPTPETVIGTVKQADPFPEHELWKTELIVRASTGPAPQD